MTLTDAEVIRASVAVLIGVAALLVLLRWTPVSVACLGGVTAAFLIYWLA